MSDTGSASKALYFIDHRDNGAISEAGRILIEWHAKLDDHKGDRAALRRATDPDAAAEVRHFAVLRRVLRNAGFDSVKYDRVTEGLAFVAIVTAGCKADVDPEREQAESLGRWFATPAHPGGKPVHEARVRLLLGAADTPQMVRLLRSCLSILDQTAPLPELADLVMGWDHPDQRARMRRRIFLDYLDALPDTASA